MYYNNVGATLYSVLMVVILIGIGVLLVLLARLILAATRALQSYRRSQEIRLDLLLAERADEADGDGRSLGNGPGDGDFGGRPTI